MTKFYNSSIKEGQQNKKSAAINSYLHLHVLIMTN